jgi:hypothetical protein
MRFGESETDEWSGMSGYFPARTFAVTPYRLIERTIATMASEMPSSGPTVDAR